MALENRLLIFSAIPFPDESFIGYLVRLMERNHYETLSWILQLAEISDFASSKFTLISNGSLDLKRLEKLTGVGQSKLTTLLYSPVKRKSKIYGYALFNATAPHHMIRLRYPKVCPSCLSESAYVRKIWELAAVTVCPIHRTLLIDECPNCNKRIMWNRDGVCRCRCKFDWRECKPPSVSDSDLGITNQVHRLCGLRANTVHKGEITNNPLYSLKLDELLSVLFFIAGQYEGVIDIRGKRLAVSKRNVDIHLLLSRAFLVFQDWPNNYFAFLDWQRKSNPDVRYVRGLRRDFGQYKYALNRQLSSVSYNFLHTAFNEYLLTKWDGGTTSNILGLNPHVQRARKYVSKAKAVALLGIEQRGIDRLIAKGRLKAIIQDQGKSKMFLIEMADVQSLIKHMQHALGIKQVCKLLGVIERRVLDLVKCGLINPILDTGADNFGRWIFSQHDVVILLSAIKNKVKRTAVADKDKSSFLSTLRGLVLYNIGTGQFVKAILDGTISPCGLGPEGNLSSLWFSHEQVVEYRKRCLLEQVGDVFTAREIALKLRITTEAVYSLLKLHIIPSRRIVGPRDSAPLITKEDLDEFSTTHIFASKVAKNLRTNAAYLSHLLIEEGLRPVSLPKSNGRFRYLFKRADLELLDLHKLTVNDRERKVLRKKEMQVLSLDQAANALNIEVEDVRDLAKRGILKPYTRNMENGKGQDDFCFSHDVIYKYERRKIDYSGLVSAGVAAKMLGDSLSSFYRKYYHSGCLKALKVGGKSKGALFFKIEDINGVMEEKKDLISSAIAAEMLGLFHSSVSRMARSGKLKPVRGPHVDGFPTNMFRRVDVEKLCAARTAFKKQCMEEGKTTRWGCPHPKLHLAYSVS